MPAEYLQADSELERRTGAAIIKVLEKATAYTGYRLYETFGDWVAVCERSLVDMPDHLRAIRTTGQPVPFDGQPEATRELWGRLQRKYPRQEVWQGFRDAFQLLQQSVDPANPADVLGNVYMSANLSNSHAGQYFTPMSVARMMAAMQMPDVHQELTRRVREALLGDPFGEALILAGLVFRPEEQPEDGPALRDYWSNRVVPYAISTGKLQPITVSDPCCGSGVMLLAAAGQCPGWAIRWNLVQFFGQDIDQDCVQMASVNMMLYGLNGYSMRLELAALEGAGTPLVAQTTPAAVVPELITDHRPPPTDPPLPPPAIVPPAPLPLVTPPAVTPVPRRRGAQPPLQLGFDFDDAA